MELLRETRESYFGIIGDPDYFNDSDKGKCLERFAEYFSQNEHGHYVLNMNNNKKIKKLASQHYQDWLLLSSIFDKSLIKSESNHLKLNYVTLGANMWSLYSNTVFLDRCLGWNGICIEPEEDLIQQLVDNRNCVVLNNCVWSEEKQMVFTRNIGADKNSYAIAGIKGQNENKLERWAKKHRKEFKEEQFGYVNKTCVALQSIIDKYNMYNIDYFNLDVEGSELHVLQGINWDKTFIHIISLEMNDKESVQFILNKGFVPKFKIFNDVILMNKRSSNYINKFDHWLELNKQKFHTYKLNHTLLYYLNDEHVEYTFLSKLHKFFNS